MKKNTEFFETIKRALNKGKASSPNPNTITQRDDKKIITYQTESKEKMNRNTRRDSTRSIEMKCDNEE